MDMDHGRLSKSCHQSSSSAKESSDSASPVSKCIDLVPPAISNVVSPADSVLPSKSSGKVSSSSLVSTDERCIGHPKQPPKSKYHKRKSPLVKSIEKCYLTGPGNSNDFISHFECPDLPMPVQMPMPLLTPKKNKCKSPLVKTPEKCFLVSPGNSRDDVPTPGNSIGLDSGMCIDFASPVERCPVMPKPRKKQKRKSPPGNITEQSLFTNLPPFDALPVQSSQKDNVPKEKKPPKPRVPKSKAPKEVPKATCKGAAAGGGPKSKRANANHPVKSGETVLPTDIGNVPRPAPCEPQRATPMPTVLTTNVPILSPEKANSLSNLNDLTRSPKKHTLVTGRYDRRKHFLATSEDERVMCKYRDDYVCTNQIVCPTHLYCQKHMDLFSTPDKPSPGSKNYIPMCNFIYKTKGKEIQCAFPCKTLSSQFCDTHEMELAEMRSRLMQHVPRTYPIDIVRHGCGIGPPVDTVTCPSKCTKSQEKPTESPKNKSKFSCNPASDPNQVENTIFVQNPMKKGLEAGQENRKTIDLTQSPTKGAHETSGQIQHKASVTDKHFIVPQNTSETGVPENPTIATQNTQEAGVHNKPASAGGLNSSEAVVKDKAESGSQSSVEDCFNSLPKFDDKDKSKTAAARKDILLMSHQKYNLPKTMPDYKDYNQDKEDEYFEDYKNVTMSDYERFMMYQTDSDENSDCEELEGHEMLSTAGYHTPEEVIRLLSEKRSALNACYLKERDFSKEIFKLRRKQFLEDHAESLAKPQKGGKYCSNPDMLPCNEKFPAEFIVNEITERQNVRSQLKLGCTTGTLGLLLYKKKEAEGLSTPAKSNVYFGEEEKPMKSSLKMNKHGEDQRASAGKPMGHPSKKSPKKASEIITIEEEEDMNEPAACSSKQAASGKKSQKGRKGFLRKSFQDDLMANERPAGKNTAKMDRKKAGRMWTQKSSDEQWDTEEEDHEDECPVTSRSKARAAKVESARDKPVASTSKAIPSTSKFPPAKKSAVKPPSEPVLSSSKKSIPTSEKRSVAFNLTKEPDDKGEVFPEECAVKFCKERPLPLTKYCLAHICKDKNQVLFVTCGSLTGHACDTPVMKLMGAKGCPIHVQQWLPDLPLSKEDKRFLVAEERKQMKLPGEEEKFVDNILLSNFADMAHLEEELEAALNLDYLDTDSESEESADDEKKLPPLASTSDNEEDYHFDDDNLETEISSGEDNEYDTDCEGAVGGIPLAP